MLTCSNCDKLVSSLTKGKCLPCWELSVGMVVISRVNRDDDLPGTFWWEDSECGKCGSKDIRCLCADSSRDEYAEVAICLRCLRAAISTVSE